MDKPQSSPDSFSFGQDKDTNNQAQNQIFNPVFDELNNPDTILTHIENLRKDLDIELWEMAEEAEIDLSKPLTPPPMVLSVDNATLFYLGDFSMTIGKAKSRKTFLNTLLMGVLVGNLNNGRIKANLPDDKRMVLSFDTEQGAYHAHKAAKRIHQLLKVNDTPNFKAYGLRKYTPQKRLKFIEFLIYNTPNLGVVFIDGIRDLISSINDEEQATMITSKLLKWTEELSIHVNCTLHMNKGDNNARGHVGTEMLNKSLTTISVSKDKQNPQCSLVEVTESRDKEPPPFIFGIDEIELPYLFPESEIEALRTECLTKKAVYPSDFENDKHGENLRNKIFQTISGHAG